MISLQSVINNVVNFYGQHKQVKKVGTDFREQIFNFATTTKNTLSYLSCQMLLSLQKTLLNLLWIYSAMI